MPLFLLKFLPIILKTVPGLKMVLPFLKGNWKILLPVLTVVVLMTMIYFKNNTIDSLTASGARLEYLVTEATAANKSLETSNTSLRAANKSLAQAVVVSEEVRADAYKKAREWELRAAIQLDDAKTKLKELENETPTCAEISRIDIGAACPLSVELLRRAAAGDFD